MDGLVQFVRNALCCVKDLKLLHSSPLYDASFVHLFYKMPEPYLSKTTPLEVLIAITQLYAAIGLSVLGVKLIFLQGLKKMIRLNRVADLLNEKSYKLNKLAVKIVNSSLQEESDNALRSTFVGFLVFGTGLTFFWLFGNSLHVTEWGLIGGVPGLVHAITVAEVLMIPLLWYMVKDGFAGIKKSNKIRSLVQSVKGKKQKDMNDNWITLDTYTMFLAKDGFAPFWIEPPSSRADIHAEEKMFIKEVEIIAKNVTVVPTATVLSDEKEDELESEAISSKLYGYRELLVFVINLVAFYGYLMGILAFHFDKEDEQHHVVRSMMFHQSNEYADWAGNLAGDLAWTIEPLVIMASPFIISRLSKVNKKKVKIE
jgi:hypothetical protein